MSQNHAKVESGKGHRKITEIILFTFFYTQHAYIPVYIYMVL